MKYTGLTKLQEIGEVVELVRASSKVAELEIKQFLYLTAATQQTYNVTLHFRPIVAQLTTGCGEHGT